MSFMLVVNTAFGSYVAGQHIFNLAEMQTVLSGPDAAKVSALADTAVNTAPTVAAASAANVLTIEPTGS